MFAWQLLFKYLGLISGLTKFILDPKFKNWQIADTNNYKTPITHFSRAIYYFNIWG